MQNIESPSIIFRIYIALVSFATLMMIIFSATGLLNTALTTFIFRNADRTPYGIVCAPEQPQADCKQQQENEKQSRMIQKEQEVARDIAMLLVSAPLFWLHARFIYLAYQKRQQETKGE